MTAVGIAIAGLGVILVWAAWNGESPIDLIREALGG